jgi:hypothetical protein
MSTVDAQLVSATLVEVLEEAAFIFAEEHDGGDVADDGRRLTVEMTVKGAVDGRFEIEAPVKFATNLAANLLGIEGDDPEAAQNGPDAMCSLLNIFAGLLLERLLPKEATYELSHPQQIPKGQASGVVTSILTEEDELVTTAVDIEY